MTWDSIQQVLRIALYSGGGYLFGDAIATGDLYQTAVSGALSVGAFVWWMVWNSGDSDA
jgi:hypothetical protein